MMSPQDAVVWRSRDGGVPHAYKNGEFLSICARSHAATGRVVALTDECCLLCRKALDPFYEPRGPVGRAFIEMFPERWVDSPGWVWTCHILDSSIEWTSLPRAKSERGKQDVLGELLTCIVEDDGVEVRDRFVELVRTYRGEGMTP